MKARHGFVSNSSSTSFVIAVREQKIEKCPHCNCSPIDYLNFLHLKTKDEKGQEYEYKIFDIKEHIDMLKEDIKNYKSAIEILTKTNEQFRAILDDLNAPKYINVLINLIGDRLKYTYYQRPFAKKSKEEQDADLRVLPYDQRASFTYASINTEIEEIQSKINALETEIKEKEEDINKYSKYAEGKWTIFKIKVDHMDADMHEVIDVMSKSQNVEIIEKKSS